MSVCTEARGFTGEVLDRFPPASPHAEKAVVASILMSPEMFKEVATIIRPDDFHLPQYRLFYERLLEMHNGGNGVIHPASLLEHFTPEQVAICGGRESLVASIAETREAVGSALEAPRHARIIAELSRRRQIIHICLDTAKDAYSGEFSSGKLCSQVTAAVERVADSVTGFDLEPTTFPVWAPTPA